MWKKLFVFVSLALLISLTINGYLWNQPKPINSPPSNVAARLEGTQDRMKEGYTGLRKEINRRAGLGEDRMSFITPDDPAVSAKVQEIAGGFSHDTSKYWKDVAALYRWVPQNIKYSPDTYTPLLPEFINDKLTWARDFWRTPEETLRDKEGDCEDMVALLVSMLLNYNQGRYGVWAIEIGNKERGHVGVALPVDKGMLIILDPSIWYTTGPIESILGTKPIATALAQWLARWEKELPGVEVRAVFTNTFWQEFGSTQEFLSWASR